MHEGHPGDGAAPAEEEPGPPMHIHKPTAPKSLAELLLEIGVIVIGIVIAVGLDQAVEFFHHSHQREQLESALRRDGEANRGYISDDIANAETIMRWALGEAGAVERAGPAGPLTLRPLPPATIGSPDAGVWPSARASGVSNLLPASAQNWLEYQAELYSETFDSAASASGRLAQAYAALDQVLMGRVRVTASGDLDISALSAEQRASLTERLRAIAEAAHVVMRQLLSYQTANAFILSTPLDQLDTPQAGQSYMRIRQRMMAAHPAANFVFGGR